MEKRYTAGVYTLGCRVNLYESEAIADRLKEKGIEVRDFSLKNDVYIINTCTVTAESDRKSRQMIRRAIKTNPQARILVCGCYSQMFTDDVEMIDGVDYIGGTTDKLLVADRAVELLRGEKTTRPEVNVNDLSDASFEKMEAVTQDRTRAFLKIEDGCDNKCSYCIIPKARGRVRSKPVCEVLAEVKRLVANGYSEIVLTGIETAAYGNGEGYGLIDLLETLEGVDGLERIRLGSMEPSYLKGNVVDRLSKLKKTAPHFHLSLQSGCDRTLNAMRRRYNTEIIRRNVDHMREKIENVTFGTDLIVGFPGETEDDHASAMSFIDSLELLNCHVFSYSVRPGTEAAGMKDQVPSEVKERRHKAMQSVADSMKKRCIERFIENKTEFRVLFETEKDGWLYGHTENFIYVKVKSDGKNERTFEKVVLKKYNEKDEMTEGELI